MMNQMSAMYMNPTEQYKHITNTNRGFINDNI